MFSTHKLPAQIPGFIFLVVFLASSHSAPHPDNAFRQLQQRQGVKSSDGLNWNYSPWTPITSNRQKNGAHPFRHLKTGSHYSKPSVYSKNVYPSSITLPQLSSPPQNYLTPLTANVPFAVSPLINNYPVATFTPIVTVPTVPGTGSQPYVLNEAPPSPVINNNNFANTIVDDAEFNMICSFLLPSKDVGTWC